MTLKYIIYNSNSYSNLLLADLENNVISVIRNIRSIFKPTIGDF